MHHRLSKIRRWRKSQWNNLHLIWSFPKAVLELGLWRLALQAFSSVRLATPMPLGEHYMSNHSRYSFSKIKQRLPRILPNQPTAARKSIHNFLAGINPNFLFIRGYTLWRPSIRSIWCQGKSVIRIHAFISLANIFFH